MEMTGSGAAKIAEYAAVIQAHAEWVTACFGLEPGTVEHYRLTELLGAIRLAPKDEANQVMACILEERRAGGPVHTAWGDIREDADWWADVATPQEIEAVVAAGLRRIDRALFAQAARKRLFVALWDSMPQADRRAFLRRVDPQAKFRGAA